MRRVKPAVVARQDEVLAVLRDAGRPMLTKELADAMARESRPDCGHDDCTRPEHQRVYPWPGYPHGMAKSLFDGMHRRGLLNRTPLDPTCQTMWWSVAARDEETRDGR